MSVEKVPPNIFPSSDKASKAVANEITALIKEKNSKNEFAVLGLATGNTPQKSVCRAGSPA